MKLPNKDQIVLEQAYQEIHEASFKRQSQGPLGHVADFKKHSPGAGINSMKFGLPDKEKGKIQNIAKEISDIPGCWDFSKDRFTQHGVLELQKALNNNKEYLKYALSLTSDDYEG